VGEHLARCLGSGTLDEVETSHNRIRETVLRHLEPGTRKEWHRRLAQAWAATAGADAEVLAVHDEGAERPEAAGRNYARAADAAAGSLAFERAPSCIGAPWSCCRRTTPGGGPARAVGRCVGQRGARPGGGAGLSGGGQGGRAAEAIELHRGPRTST
jgi:hypothetical protein